MSRAACEAWNFTSSRSPKKRKVRDEVPSADASATATVPTGFSAVPPVGPAIPVMPTPRSAPARYRMPSAIARATGSLTAPWAARTASGTPKSDVFASFAYATMEAPT